jgi:Na+-transporting NADH:ubiquinone oxidoreductase subunit C
VSQRSSIGYTIGFAALICVVCAVLVSSAAVTLRERQQANAELYRKINVLQAAGLATPDEAMARDDVERRFASFEVVAIDLESGEVAADVDVATYDQRRAQSDPTASRTVGRNAAQITRVPNRVLAYRQLDDAGNVELLVLPIEGKGLWSTLYGYLALGSDLTTIRGLTYYEHAETAGLGGEVDNPRWKALWPGRKVYDEGGDVAIEVVRGSAGPAETDPYRVDGLSGATITSRGVTAMIEFWLGPQGYGPYLQRLKKEAA